tara:strand:+ start:832 stop:1254 length:423 start_codon:yes stop_codon:yes gene_type:complete
MKNQDPLAFNIKDITEIEPEYDFKKVGEGKFQIHIDHDVAFTIRMGAFMDWQLKRDQKENDGQLFMFMMNGYSDKTVSHVVYDLYDIGFPVDDWIKDYIDHLTSHSARYANMLQLLDTLKRFGKDNNDDEDLDGYSEEEW